MVCYMDELVGEFQAVVDSMPEALRLLASDKHHCAVMPKLSGLYHLNDRRSLTNDFPVRS